ncbi:MAG: histidine phosphatase family protein [Sandaracinus sp.]|nr:histidine phosphatase family protein [Sandaracinus sp.]
MALIAIRHAPTHAEGLCVGRYDVATKVPHEDAARTILERWSGAPADFAWSSPLSRCAEPAHLVAHAWSRPHRVDERVLELAYGAWEGRAWSDLQREDGERLRAWMDAWTEAAPPEGESVAALEARVRAWWQTLPSGRHLLVAHAGVVRALRVIVRGATWEEAMREPVPHLQPTRF